MRSWRARLLIVAVLLSPAQGLVAAGPACLIAEGQGIAGVRVGMAAAEALAAAGPPTRQQTEGSRVTYTLRPPLAQMVADRGIIARVATRSSECRTVQGAGPGSRAEDIRALYASSPISTVTSTAAGDLLSYPFAGVAFLMRAGHAVAVEVFPADSLGSPPSQPVPQAAVPASATAPAAPRAPGPSPTPTTAPGTWSIRSTTTRVEDGSLVVSGTVENRDRATAVYAEVRALTAAGVQVGQGEAPVQPNPVPSGRMASFDVRVAIEQVVRRYTVIIHPIGSPSVVLTRTTGEIRDVQQFAAMAARQLSVTVQAAAQPAPTGFTVQVTNGSPLQVESVSVSVELTVTCRIATGRTIQETWSGFTTVRSVAPRSSSQAPLPLSGGVCLVFTSWSATHRISDVKIAE